MTKDEIIKALRDMAKYPTVTLPRDCEALRMAADLLAQPEQEPVACVYKATTKKGETAHFGEYSAAKAWAGWGTVEQVPLKTLTLIPKSIKPCATCEALARTVMLDQTSHDTATPQRTWVGLTDEEVDECYYWKDRLWTTDELVRHVEAKLKEKNT